jgi:predicted NAD/FAD-binding protein
MPQRSPPLDIAVIGSGIAGMAAAWLLSQRHSVTVYEQAGRPGGHSNTIEVPGVGPVDMGFIVYNEATYPNLTALFRHLDVPTAETDMSFAVSLDDGALEYGTADLAGLFAQKRNLLRPRFWAMVSGLLRFYRLAPQDLPGLEDSLDSLDLYLARRGFGEAFRRDHLQPMAAAIWSTPAGKIGDYPAAAFIRFCENHGLLKLTGRPAWRTVIGGSRNYVERLTAPYRDRLRLGHGIVKIQRENDAVRLTSTDGSEVLHDHVVIASHPDQALAMLTDAGPDERALLGAIRYLQNPAVMHRDASLMPRRRRAWSSWNYLGCTDGSAPSVTYWMNRLQPLGSDEPVFVTLNPSRAPAPGTVIHEETYSHPLYDAAALAAQRRLWSLQGVRRAWYCGAWFGAGFHEDALQAGLAVAEQLGGVRRPWSVAQESGRITIDPASFVQEAA